MCTYVYWIPQTLIMHTNIFGSQSVLSGGLDMAGVLSENWLFDSQISKVLYSYTFDMISVNTKPC